jgi:hypothetical protein
VRARLQRNVNAAGAPLGAGATGRSSATRSGEKSTGEVVWPTVQSLDDGFAGATGVAPVGAAADGFAGTTGVAPVGAAADGFARATGAPVGAAADGFAGATGVALAGAAAAGPKCT